MASLFHALCVADQSQFWSALAPGSSNLCSFSGPGFGSKSLFLIFGLGYKQLKLGSGSATPFIIYRWLPVLLVHLEAFLISVGHCIDYTSTNEYRYLPILFIYCFTAASCLEKWALERDRKSPHPRPRLRVQILCLRLDQPLTPTLHCTSSESHNSIIMLSIINKVLEWFKSLFWKASVTTVYHR